MQFTQVPGASNFKKGRILTLVNFSALSPINMIQVLMPWSKGCSPQHETL